MKKSDRKTSGFTLIEIILVMIILTFVVAAIAPSLRTFGVGRSTNNMASAIVKEAEYARVMAISEGRTYRLNFDPQGRSFWLTVMTGATPQTLGSDLGQKIELPQSTNMRTDIVAQQGGSFVEFHADGRCDTGHIWITDSQGKQIEVACDSPTELFRIVPQQDMTR